MKLKKSLAFILSNFLAFIPSYKIANASPANNIATISVEASGEAIAVPDMAVLDLGVSKHSSTATEALRQNRAALNNIIASLKKYKIKPNDIQTSNLSIYESSDEDKEKAIKKYSYTAQNDLSIRIKNLDLLGEIYDNAIESGANHSSNLSFSNQNPEPYIEEARIKAVKNAIAKSNTLAKAAGMKIDKIISIEESENNRYMGRSNIMFTGLATSAGSTPIEKGELSYKVNVTMKFSLIQ